MKKKILGLVIGLLLIGVSAFAADGDLIVNGNLGVGTSSLTAPLTILADSSANGIRILGRSGDGAGVLMFRNNAGSANMGGIQVDSTGFNILSGTSGATGKFVVDANGNVGIGTNTGLAGILHVKKGYTSTPAIRIESAAGASALQQALYITTDTYSGASNIVEVDNSQKPIFILRNDGLVRLGNYTTNGTLTTTGGDGTLSTSSDESLKDIKGYYTKGLEAILTLKPILYDWNEKSGIQRGYTYLGFSAQNVQESIPEAVSINNDGYLGLSDRGIIAALVNAVKEQQKIIEGLKSAIEQINAGKQ